MKFLFLTASHRFPGWLTDVTEDYSKRLSHWNSVELKICKPLPLARENKVKKKSFESQALGQALLPDDFVVVCDEKGRALSTENFAGQLEKVLGSGKKRLVFIVGGAYGLEQNILERANLKLSLSPFTVTHHLALAICFEQTYRAMTILRGVPYHNA